MPAFARLLLAGGMLCASASGSTAEPGRPMAEAPEGTMATAPAAFTARWDDHWQMARLDDGCELTLQVGAFGQARFLARRGESLRFELLERQPLLSAAGVSTRAVAPSWHPRHPHAGRWETVSQVPGYGLQLAQPRASALLMSLYQGFEQEIGADAAYGRPPALLLTLSVLGFRSAYDDFLRCQAHLRPSSLLALHRSRIQFATGKFLLRPEDRARLREVAAYIVSDPRIARVYVDGYTDDVGSDRDNVALSKKRAGAVADLLASAGVERSLLKVRYHGERYPVSRASSADARAKNRRTTVRVELGTGASG